MNGGHVCFADQITICPAARKTLMQADYFSPRTETPIRIEMHSTPIRVMSASADDRYLVFGYLDIWP